MRMRSISLTVVLAKQHVTTLIANESEACGSLLSLDICTHELVGSERRSLFTDRSLVVFLFVILLLR